MRCEPRFYGDSCQHFNDCPSGDVCGLNGTCIDGQDSYSCHCDPGFTGENCEIEIPTETEIQFRVVTTDSPCDPGYTGTQCTVNINDCVEVNCSGRGQCMDEVNTFTCSCDPGFTGANCQINIANCLEANNCSEHGQCARVDGVDSFTCECDSGYTGELCDSAVAPDCSSMQCVNGSCSPLNESSESVCSCDPGYTGENCHIDIDDCSGIDCGDNYRCVDGVNSYDCVCDFGYAGNSCELSNEGWSG